MRKLSVVFNAIPAVDAAIFNRAQIQVVLGKLPPHPRSADHVNTVPWPGVLGNKQTSFGALADSTMESFFPTKTSS